jgi:hypothetical protein
MMSTILDPDTTSSSIVMIPLAKKIALKADFGPKGGK